MLGGRHGDVHDRYRVGHLRIPSSVGPFDGAAERPDGSAFPDAGHAAEDHPTRRAELLPAVEPHEEHALGHSAVEDRGLQRGQLRVVVTALVVVDVSRSASVRRPSLASGEQGHRPGIMLHEHAPAIQRGHYAGREARSLQRRHGTPSGVEHVVRALTRQTTADPAFSYPSSSGSGGAARIIWMLLSADALAGWHRLRRPWPPPGSGPDREARFRRSATFLAMSASAGRGPDRSSGHPAGVLPQGEAERLPG